MRFSRAVFAEAVVGSAGILLAGFVTVPLAAWFVGADVSAEQGAQMGAIFFVGRVMWLAVVRALFKRFQS